MSIAGGFLFHYCPCKYQKGVRVMISIGIFILLKKGACFASNLLPNLPRFDLPELQKNLIKIRNGIIDILDVLWQLYIG
jgi:hypothetical protein